MKKMICFILACLWFSQATEQSERSRGIVFCEKQHATKSPECFAGELWFRQSCKEECKTYGYTDYRVKLPQDQKAIDREAKLCYCSRPKDLKQ